MKIENENERRTAKLFLVSLTGIQDLVKTDCTNFDTIFLALILFKKFDLW